MRSVEQRPELRLLSRKEKPPATWQEIVRREITADRDSIVSGQEGYSKRREINDKVFNFVNPEGLTITQLGNLRMEVKDALSLTSDSQEKMMHRSLLGKIDFSVRQIICEARMGKKVAKSLSGAAFVCASTRGLSVSGIDYQKLEETVEKKMIKLSEENARAERVVSYGEVESILREEAQKTSQRLRQKFPFLQGIGARISLPEFNPKVALIAASALMLLWGFRFFDFPGAKGGQEITGKLKGNAAEQAPPLAQDPLLEFKIGETPVVPNGADKGLSGHQVAETIKPTPPVMGWAMAEKSAANLQPASSSTEGQSSQAAESPKKEFNVAPGDNVILEGEVFGNKSFGLRAVLPTTEGRFGLDELVLGGFSLANPNKVAIWGIHSGITESEVLPGEFFLGNFRGGEELVVRKEEGAVALKLVAQFSLNPEGYYFDERVISAEAKKHGHDLAEGKYLALVTCDERDPETGEYNSRVITLFQMAS